jgi:hypothetical protein
VNAKTAKPKKQAKQSGKARADDPPGWAKHRQYDPSKSADKNARDALDEKYGKGNWKDRTNTEHSKIKKWLQRFKGYK